MKKRIVFLAAGAIAVFAVVAIVFLGGPDPEAFEFDWPAGTQYIYSLEYSSRSSSRMLIASPEGAAMDQTFRAEASFKGELVVRSYGRQDNGSYALGIGLRKLSEHRLDFMDQLMIADATAADEIFHNREIVVEVDTQGRVDAIHVPRDAPPLFGSTMQTLLGEIQIVIQPGRRAWEIEETNQTGSGEVAYSHEEPKDGLLALTKTREAYEHIKALEAEGKDSAEDVDASWSILLDPDGHMTRFEGSEAFTAGDGEESAIDQTSRVALSLISVGRYDEGPKLPDLLSAARSRKLGEIVVSEKAERESLRRRAGGMQVEQLLADVGKYGNGGRMPFHNRWIWQATGLLQLEPEACRDLVKVFESPQMRSTGRALVLDLLTSVGHKEAQAAMRKVLSGEIAAADPKFSSLLQRMSLLEQPEAETAALARQLMGGSSPEEEAGRHVHYAAAYSLGAIAGQLNKAGDTERGGKYNDELKGMLAGAQTPEQRKAYLAALGNVGIESNVPFITEFATDPSRRVRQAVVSALRKTQTSESEQVLLTLAGDKESTVQHDAIRVLAKYEVNQDHLVRVEELVDKDAIGQRNFGPLTDLLSDQLNRGGEPAAMSRRMLGSLLSKELAPKLRSRIRHMLEG